jgi:hypothetical protein
VISARSGWLETVREVGREEELSAFIELTIVKIMKDSSGVCWHSARTLDTPVYLLFLKKINCPSPTVRVSYEKVRPKTIQVAVIRYF